MNTLEKIRSLLGKRDLKGLVGLREDTWFDAKQPPGYASTPAGRFELAKDVSSFANEEGGAIIVGLQTEVLGSEKTEVVKALDLLEENEFNVSQIIGVLKDYLHPLPKEVDVRWISSQEDTALGVGVILIPDQAADRRPFLINRVIESGDAVKQIAFGYARRVGASSQPLTVDEIYRMCQQGRSTTSERLVRIEEKIDHLTFVSAKSESTAVSYPESVEARLNKLREHD